jgi:uncharacterized membrane protein (DUF2068 family)
MPDASQGQLESQPASQQHAEAHVIDLPTLAAHEAKQVIIFTGDVLTTTAALLTSALGLVAALAWNNFMQAWLPTINPLNVHDPIIKDLVYALVVTLIAVLSVVLISRVRKRIRGRNLFTP